VDPQHLGGEGARQAAACAEIMANRSARFTPRQREIYDYIRRYTLEHGYAPSLMEIRDHLQLSAVSTVHEHLVNMQEKGLLRREDHAARSATVASMTGAPSVTLPLLGSVVAGPPTESFVSSETIAVPGSLVGRGPHYGLRVMGESMRDEHILPGDVLVVRQTNRAERGDMVIALVEGSETTVKRFYPERNHVRLQPSNRELRPIRVAKQSVLVQGVVVGLLRQFAHA
jgi:repressor LexA